MKNILILTLAICCNLSIVVAEKISIYTTINDYKNNTPIVLDGELSAFPDVNAALQYKSGIKIKTSEKKETFLCSDFWGFKYKDVLFRNFKFNLKYTKDGKTSYGFMGLISEGKICYWENGIGVVNVLNSEKEKKKGEIKDLACNGKFGLSKTIESDISTSRFNSFINTNKEYNGLPTEFKKAALIHDDCPLGLKKENGLKTADKLMDFGGVDDIAFLNAAAGVNNYAGKPMGISAALYIHDLSMKYIRDFFRKYNSGNFNDVVYNSKYI